MTLRPFLLTAVGASALTGAATADFTGVYATADINPDPEIRTFQLYANFDNPLDTLLAVGGIPGLAPVVFNSSFPLVNDDGPFAGSKLADFPGDPISGEFDSWVSVNQTTFFDGDTDYSEDFAGLPTGEQAILGTTWEEYDGGWFDSDPGTPEQGTSLIIAQFSFDQTVGAGGSHSFEQISATFATLSGLVNWAPAGASSGFVSSEFIVYFPAPGALALFGGAALVGLTRRRRA